jgi:hypothetical protein
MPIDNRANNEALINTNKPDNVLELITPLKDREVDYNLNDSCFNKLDEPRDVAQNIVFVSPDGDDLNNTKGDMSTPFQTIQAGIDAVGSFGTVKVLGGSYIESPNIGINTNIIIDIRGCNITGGFVKGIGNNVVLIGYGAIVNASGSGALIMQDIGMTVYGGTYNGLGTTPAVDQQVAGGGSFYDCVFRSQNATCVEGNTSLFVNCDIETTGAGEIAAVLSDTSCMRNCRVVGTLLGVQIINTTVELDNCKITGDAGVAGQDTLNNDCNIIITNNTVITANTGNGLTLVRNCEKVLVQDSQIYAAGDCILYFANTQRLNNAVNIYKNSYFRSTGGAIITENYAGGDTGDAEFSNCFTNIALGALTKVTETNTVVNANIQKLQ